MSGDGNGGGNPFLKGNYAPWPMEGEIAFLEVEGTLPEGLNGTLYRIGPNPQFPEPQKKKHWFLGDGMVHAVTVEDGRARYRNRWVRTETFRLEREAGRPLFGSSFGPSPDMDPSVQDKRRNVANTNIIVHGGRLLALEEGNPAYEMDAATLDSKAPFTWDDKAHGPMTAHPHWDGESGELLWFGYQAKGPGSPELSFRIADRDGRISRADMLTAPYAAMVHDFAVTRSTALFPVFPATIDIPRILSGGPVIAWDPDMPSTIGLLRRDAPADSVRWLEGDPCYVFHILNAYDAEDGTIVLDVMKYPRVPLFPDKNGGRPDPLEEAEAVMVRWTIDPDGNSNSWRESVLDDVPGEFPRIDDRYSALPHRHGWFAGRRGPVPPGGAWQHLVHLDLETGQRQFWQAGEHDFVVEPVFAPRSADAPEGDGWLVTPVYKAAEHRSDVVIHDALDIEAGPVATIKLPHRIPYGFHGNWVPA